MEAKVSRKKKIRRVTVEINEIRITKIQKASSLNRLINEGLARLIKKIKDTNY